MKLPAWNQARTAPPSLGKNILWVVLSRFGTQGLAVLFTIVLARRFGSAGFGEYAFIAAAIFLGNALSTFGTDMLLIREIARREELAQLAPALVIQLGLSLGVIGLIWAGAPLLPNQSADSAAGLRIYSLSLLPLAFFSVFTTAMRGMQRMDAYMLLNLGVAALQLGVVWVFVPAGSSVARLAWLLLLVQCGGAVLGGLLCAARIPGFWRGWHVSWAATAALARLSAPIALIAVIGILYQKVSIYMLSTLAGAAATGWFSAALRVIEASKMVHLAVFTALYPAMAKEGGGIPIPGRGDRPVAPTEDKPWQVGGQNTLKVLMAGAVGLSLGIFLFAGPVVGILFGAGYAPAAEGLRLISFILIPFTLNTFFALARVAEGKERVVLRVQLVGLLALLGLNAWWIPRWGVGGACLAFVLAETLQALLYLLPLRRGSRATGQVEAGHAARSGES